MSTVPSIPVVQMDSAVELADAVAKLIVDKLVAAIQKSGEASLVLSGGSTPKPLFEALSRVELPWEKVTITLADERWVPESDSDSNAAFVKRLLLINRAADAKFVSLYVPEKTPEEGAPIIHQNLQSVPTPFTVVVLGMGADGHTASLFPDAPGTEAALQEKESLVSIVKPASVPQARITLTLAALMNTDCQVLHITGAQKRELVDEVLADVPASKYPIANFLSPDNSRMTVFSTH